MSVPNVEDKDIRTLVIRDHRPEEIWRPDGRGMLRFEAVICLKCKANWPCRSIEEARRVARREREWIDGLD